MDSKTVANGITRAVLNIAGLVFLGYLIYLLQSVILYVVMAAITSLTGRPIVLFLRRRLKFNSGVAVITTMIMLYGFLLGSLGLFIPLMIQRNK